MEYWALSVFGVIGLLSAAWAWRRRQIRAGEAQLAIQDTLRASDQLLSLVEMMQQHRGMSSAWLSGDSAFESRMRGKRAEVEGLLPNLLASADLESRSEYACFTSHDVSLFRFKWHEVVNGLTTATVEQNIAKHNQMIAQLLEWLAALGEARLAPLANPQCPVGVIRNFSHRLPLLAECLGQARAIGSSVAAKHGCPPVARVRLMFLIGRAEGLLAQAISGDSSRVGDQAHKAVSEMAAMVRAELLQSSGIQVSAQAYFAVATRAVESVFAWARETERQLHRDIHYDSQRRGDPVFSISA